MNTLEMALAYIEESVRRIRVAEAALKEGVIAYGISSLRKQWNYYSRHHYA